MHQRDETTVGDWDNENRSKWVGVVIADEREMLEMESMSGRDRGLGTIEEQGYGMDSALLGQCGQAF